MSKPNSKYWIVNKLDEKTAEILIYGDIANYRYDESCVSANSFVKELKALEAKCTRINLRINCNGGSVMEGIAIFNTIMLSKCEIYGYIDGIAASMASLIALACKKLYMSKYARLMTHQASGGAWGTEDDLMSVIGELKAANATANQIIQEKTKMSEADVTAKFLNKKDNYFSAKTASGQSAQSRLKSTSVVSHQFAGYRDCIGGGSAIRKPAPDWIACDLFNKSFSKI